MEHMLKYWRLIDKMMICTNHDIQGTPKDIYNEFNILDAYIIFKKFQSDSKTNGKSYRKQMTLVNSICVWSNYRYYLNST